MTTRDPRSCVLERFGYTPRQAAFLTLVARHGGYFLRRQYVAFTGHGHGLATVRFLDQAVAREHLRALPYGRHGHVFHLYARPLYAMLGEEHNRNRRTAEWDAVIRKLMTVDFAISQHDAMFWTGEQDKAALLTELHVPRKLWPVRRYESKRAGALPTDRYFVDKMPWYRIREDARLWFAYVDAEVTLAGFETFLMQYRDVFQVIASGVTYVAPTAWRGAIQPIFDRVLAAGQPSIYTVSTVCSYFRLRQKVEAQRFEELRVADLSRFRTLRERYGVHVDDLYARWLLHGEKSIARSDLDRVAPSCCALRVHALNQRYDDLRGIAKRERAEPR